MNFPSKNKMHNFLILFILTSLFNNLDSKQITSFNNIFEKEKEIIIRTKNLEVGILTQIKIDFYNNIIFLDAKVRQVLVFNQEGKFLKRIGKKGQGPGEFIHPLAMGIDKHGKILISDQRVRRINKFDKDGYFISSFIISGSHFSPNDIIIVDSKDSLFLGGYRENFNNPGAGTWINKYDSKGKYIRSFFPRNTTQRWMLSMFPSFSFDMDEKDIIYAVQINEYKISVYNSEGRLLRTFAKAPYYFKKPDPNLRVDFSKFKSQSKLMEELIKLSKSWTKILRIKVVKNKYLLLVLETNNLIKGFNKKYVIDVWDKKGNLIAGGIQTDYKFFCTDKDGYVYFLTYTDEEEALEKDPEYRIGKFRIKID